MPNDMDNERVRTESQLIYLLLHNKSALEDFCEKGFSPDFFSDENKPLVVAIMETYSNNGVLLTIEGFEEFKKGFQSISRKIALDVAFSNCYASKTDKNNFPLLMKKVLDNAIHENLNKALMEVQKNLIDKVSVSDVVKSLRDRCEDMLLGIEFGGEVYFENVIDLSRRQLKYLEDYIDGKIQEDPIILTGIPEVDETMGTGLEKGTLTLFCADVGGFKSAIMLNIAMNVADSGYRVLYVPLEMSHDQMWKRMLARDSRIDSRKFFKDKKDLRKEDKEKLQGVIKNWENRKGEMYIMERHGGTSVKDIEREIKRRINIFKPDVVVIDYIANLQAHINRYGRNDLEIGDMLKKMRDMGKEMGFAVISAAQIGRDALKRLRKDGANKDKPQVNSEDIRGSHEYAADADNIYAMLKDNQQPGSRLYLFCVKARNGKTFFGEDEHKVRAVLHVIPKFGLVYSPTQDRSDVDEEQLEKMISETEAHSSEIVKKKENDTFFDEEKDWSAWMGEISSNDEKSKTGTDEVNAEKKEDIDEDLKKAVNRVEMENSFDDIN